MIENLLAECRNRNLNVSITYQRINDLSVEIYTGYQSSYKCLLYIDSFHEIEPLIQNALNWLNTKYKENSPIKQQ